MLIASGLGITVLGLRRNRLLTRTASGNTTRRTLPDAHGLFRSPWQIYIQTRGVGQQNISTGTAKEQLNRVQQERIA